MACGRAVLVALWLVATPGWSSPSSRLMSAVAVTPTFFNPSLKQQASLQLNLARPASISVTILDRDRIAVRHFAARPMAAGPAVVRWDGRDDAGAVVPNEAYTVRIEAAEAGGTSTVYDPAEHFTPQSVNPPIRSYSRADGVLSYSLARPSRVHIQAGEARPDPRTGVMDGPILKTLVDREPRVAGAVVEVWNGMDESGTIYVPGLPHFAVAVLAASLPENAIIVAGGEGQDFAAYARAHRPPQPLRSLRAAPPQFRHHQGLSGLEDRSPRLVIEPRGAWDPIRRRWSVSPAVVVRVSIPREQAPFFLTQPTALTAYVDEVPVLHLDHPANPQELSLPGRLPAGEHRLVVNWASAFGPVGVAAAKIVARTPAAKPGRNAR